MGAVEIIAVLVFGFMCCCDGFWVFDGGGVGVQIEM